MGAGSKLRAVLFANSALVVLAILGLSISGVWHRIALEGRVFPEFYGIGLLFYVLWKSVPYWMPFLVVGIIWAIMRKKFFEYCLLPLLLIAILYPWLLYGPRSFSEEAAVWQIIIHYTDYLYPLVALLGGIVLGLKWTRKNGHGTKP